MKIDPNICNMEKLADSMEQYIDLVDRYIIIDGMTESEKKEHIKVIRKAIKKIRKGDYDDVISKKKYQEFLRNKDNMEDE